MKPANLEEAHRPTIRVSIVEDGDRSRRSLVGLLNGAPGFQVVSAHPSAEAALQALPLDRCDVVLMDLSLPGLDGIFCTRELKQRRPEVQILILTVHTDQDRIFESLKAGASGYLLKQTSDVELLEAIREMADGGSPMSPAIARKVTQFFHGLEQARPAVAQGRAGLKLLSDREREVLGSIARGCTNKEIAESLGISAHTVDKHIRHIYEKLQVQTRAEATARYLTGRD